MSEDLVTLFDAQDLEVDQAVVARADHAVIGDEQIRVLQHANRIALARGHGRRITPPRDPGRVYLDVPLLCVVHSHPECRFTWSRLEVSLQPTPGAKIRDMAPREVRGQHPTELKTTIGLELKFASVSVTPEHTNSRTVYFPEIVSSGVGFSAGAWDFMALGGEYLHANRELRLLVSAPADAWIIARFSFKARVTLAGFGGQIPLLARHGAIEETYSLE